MRERLVPALAAGIPAVALVLALSPIHDSDVWTHLALGREMVRRGAFPATEPFVFPGAALPYYNTEWLFDLVLYLAHAAAGVAGVIVLKALVVALVFWLLWKDARLGRRAREGALAVAVPVAVLLPAMLIARHRFVERPDIVLMLFLVFTIYALNAYLEEGRRLLYAVPLVQVLWVNMHPSTVVGMIPFLAALGAGLGVRLAGRWAWMGAPPAPDTGRLRTIAVVFAAFLGAALLNPYGTDAFTLPFRLVDLAWFRHEILELRPPTLTEDPAPFVLVALLALALLATARAWPLREALLAAPFAYLGVSGRRFVFLLAVVAAPILARALRRLAAAVPPWRPVAVGGAIAAAAAGGVAVVATVAELWPFGDRTVMTRIGVDAQAVPEGALRYLDAIGVQGRVFNTFHWGGYIEWRDFPRRAPIVDGRGYVPPGVIEQISFARIYPAELQQLHARYGFEAAIVDYPVYAGESPEESVGPDVDLGLASSEWALVYFDDTALVYLHRSDALAPVIARDGYRYLKPVNGPAYMTRLLADRTVVPAVDAEIRRHIASTASSIGELLRGYAALTLGAPDRAVEAFGRVRDGRRAAERAEGLAVAYWRQGDRDRAIDAYRTLATLTAPPRVLYNVGRLYAERGDDREAGRYLERARKASPDFVGVYPALLSVYQRLGDQEHALALGAPFQAAIRRAQAEEQIGRSLALQRDGKSAEAQQALEEALRLDPGNPRAHSFLGYLYLYGGRLEEAVAEQRAALRADPGFARARYGLALVQLKRGDTRAARRELEAYVHLEPRSYGAWKARETIARLGR
jgi:Flp pilus assembly protein TadD